MAVHTPIESRETGVPRWALGLTVFLFLVGGVYFLGNLSGENPAFALPGATQPPGTAAPGTAPPNADEALAVIEGAGCQSCHGTDLSGQASFPSLLNVSEGPVSENLQQLAADHPEDWVALWIDGTDPAVADLDRRGMPTFGGTLTPEEIELIAEYLKGL